MNILAKQWHNKNKTPTCQAEMESRAKKSKEIRTVCLSWFPKKMKHIKLCLSVCLPVILFEKCQLNLITKSDKEVSVGVIKFEQIYWKSFCLLMPFIFIL